MRRSLGAGAALLVGSAAAASPLGMSCTGCHFPSVNSAEMPALDHLSAARIAVALRAARDAPHPGSIMARFAAKLSDDDIERLAAELGAPAR